MKKLKSIICMFLAAVMLCSALVACGDTTGGNTPAVSGGDTSSVGGEVADENIPEKYEHLSANGITTWDTGYMRENLTSLEITRLMGNGTNLGNTMEACDSNVGKISDDPGYYEKLWGQPITTQEIISGIKDAGFDTLRIPVAWMTNATDLAFGDYTISEAYLDRVEEIINYALNEDMYVIVNDHWDGGWYGMFGSDDAAMRELAMEAYKGMWTQIAERYKEYSDYLIFEGANEEMGDRLDENATLYAQDSLTSRMTQDECYALAAEITQAFVDTVRATGGNNAKRFLLIPGYNTNIANTCDDRYIMPTDEADRLLISVHYYDPWNYCGDGDSTVSWGTKQDLETMNESLAKMTKFTEQGYGVVIGEYGVLQNSDGSLRKNLTTYHTMFLDLCDIYGYTSCLWDCSGFYKRSQLKMGDADFAAVYADRNFASESALSADEVKAKAIASAQALYDAAPETFREDAVQVTADFAYAWIMWNSGDWNLTYSVGDVYNADNISEGLVPTDVIIEGPGTYTVGLDFTGTAMGYSANTAFSALAIANGEDLFPGYIIHIKEVLINGEPFTMVGRPYTCSDDQHCTRVNLYNAWVTQVPADGRTIGGGMTGCTPTPISNNPVLDHIETIEITFDYIDPNA